MLPGLHAIEHSQLLLWRQTGEALQPIPVCLLPCGWQTPECRIAFQCVFPLVRRQVRIAPQPITGMALIPRRSRMRARRFDAWWRWCLMFLRETPARNRNCQPCSEQMHDELVSPLHMFFVTSPNISKPANAGITDSLLRPAADQGHPVNRNWRRGRDSCPESASH
jgi:hypothetical protein